MNREKLTFAMGCFWGPEDRFARIPGVTRTQVGYAGGEADIDATPECPEEVKPADALAPASDSNAVRSSDDRRPSSERTGPSDSEPPTHRRLNGRSEVVEVEFDPQVVTLDELLKHFWSEHHPAAIESYKPEDSRYRSLLFYRDEKQRAVMRQMQRKLAEQGFSSESTGLRVMGDFYPAEDKHQRYREKKRQKNSDAESKLL